VFANLIPHSYSPPRKSFSRNTYKKQGGWAVMVNQICERDRRPGEPSEPRGLSLLLGTQCPVLSVAILFQGPLDWCRDNFTDAFAQRRHIFLPQTLGLDSVVQ
jgi:hypothetical protein